MVQIGSKSRSSDHGGDLLTGGREDHLTTYDPRLEGRNDLHQDLSPVVPIQGLLIGSKSLCV